MPRVNVTIEDVRVFMRDVLERNDLLERLEFADKEIENAMYMATDIYNLLPPISNEIPEAFPNRSLLIIGTAAILLTSEAIAQIRNQLNYSDGGIHVSVDDKMAPYLQLGGTLRSQFEQLSSQYKLQRNIDSVLGGQFSPYYSLPVF